MVLKNEQGNLILGRFKREVIALFGDVQVGSKGVARITWRADKILPNYYGNPLAGQEPEKNPIYILVPDTDVEVVWPGRGFDDVKFGTADRHRGGPNITTAVGIFKGTALLYICLKPLSETEVDELEVGSLGM
jgi:hypothetical protein